MENNVPFVAANDAAVVAADAAVVVNPANGAEAPQQQPQPEAPKAEVAEDATKSLLEIAQMGQKGFKLQCEKYGKILTSDSLATLAKTVEERLAELPTYEANLKALLVEIHQKQAMERFEEIKGILKDLTPEQKQQLGIA